MARRRLPEKLYRIGEVIEHTGLSRQTLHFYATIGLIREKSRTRAGYRLFPPTVFASLDRIRALKKKGYTLREIREKLEKRHTPRPVAAKTKTETETETARTETSPQRGRPHGPPPESPGLDP